MCFDVNITTICLIDLRHCIFQVQESLYIYMYTQLYSLWLQNKDKEKITHIIHVIGQNGVNINA